MQRSVSIGERAHALVGINRDSLENLVLVPPVNVIEVRDRVDIRSRIGLFAGIIFADRDEILRLGERQRPQQHCIDYAEHSGVSTNPERKR